MSGRASCGGGGGVGDGGEAGRWRRSHRIAAPCAEDRCVKALAGRWGPWSVGATSSNTAPPPPLALPELTSADRDGAACNGSPQSAARRAAAAGAAGAVLLAAHGGGNGAQGGRRHCARAWVGLERMKK